MRLVVATQVMGLPDALPWGGRSVTRANSDLILKFGMAFDQTPVKVVSTRIAFIMQLIGCGMNAIFYARN